MNKKVALLFGTVLLVIIVCLLGYRWYLHGLQKEYGDYQIQGDTVQLGDYTVHNDITDEVEFVISELEKIGFTGHIVREDDIASQQDIPDELRSYADKVDHFYSAINSEKSLYVVVVDGNIITIEY